LESVSIEAALGALNDLYSKYKYMETSFERSKAVYKSKIPEISQSIELIEAMVAKRDNEEEMLTKFSLCDTIYASAKVFLIVRAPPNFLLKCISITKQVDTSASRVCLWMGANTMVEYSYEEALDLLRLQREQSLAKIAELNEDLQDLRANSITVEVNMARLFNHNVKVKKITAAATAIAGSA
jgi:prefoldin subunit 5